MSNDVRPPATAGTTQSRRRWRLLALVVAAVLAAGGLGAGLALSFGGSSPPAPAGAPYSYYRSVMGRYGPGSMMGGGGYGWMMGRAGYGWMMGGAAAPGWMAGGSLPEFMMGGGADPGEAMGRLFAGAPGPRVATAEATALGDQVPPGATVDRRGNRITFTAGHVELTVLAGPGGGPDDTYRAAGLVNPVVTVPAGATVAIRVVNADAGSAHGLVLTAPGASSSWMPMMTSGVAFPGAAAWFLGDATPAGMHEATIRFTVGRTGTYQYLCPVPGHAQKGMAGTFLVGRGS